MRSLAVMDAMQTLRLLALPWQRRHGHLAFSLIFFKIFFHSINKSAIPSAQQYIWFTPFCWPPTRPPPHQPTLLSSCCCGCWSAGGGLFPLHHQPFNCSTLKYIAPFKPETGEPECGLTWINKVRALFSKKKEEKIRQKWRTFIF